MGEGVDYLDAKALPPFKINLIFSQTNIFKTFKSVMFV